MYACVVCVIKHLKMSLVYTLPEDGEEMTPNSVLAITNKYTVQKAGIKCYTCNKSCTVNVQY